MTALNVDNLESIVNYDNKKVSFQTLEKLNSKHFADGLSELANLNKNDANKLVDLTEADKPDTSIFSREVDIELDKNIEIKKKLDEEIANRTSSKKNILNAIAHKIHNMGNGAQKDYRRQMLDRGAKFSALKALDDNNKKARSLLRTHEFWDGEVIKQQTALGARIKEQIKAATGKSFGGDVFKILKAGDEQSSVVSDLISNDKESSEMLSKCLYTSHKSAESAKNVQSFIDQAEDKVGLAITAEVKEKLTPEEGAGSVSRIENSSLLAEKTGHKDVNEGLKEMLDNIKGMLGKLAAIFGMKR
jgi:hypothetical protein